MFESILTEIVEKAAFFEQDRALWMGDFNVALDPELDTTTTFYHVANVGARKRKILQTLIANHELTDVW